MTFASDPVRALLRTAGPLPAEPRVLCLGDDTLARLLPACGAHVDTQARTDTEARAGIEAPANVDAAAGTSYHMVCGPEADRRHLPLLAPGGVVVGDTVIRRAEDEALRRRLAVADCPRAAAYPPRWVLDYEMGPNPLWLTEALAADMDLAPGMRVLDLGCGNALTSVFLAREFASVVWAADLWIDPGPNWARIRAAGVDDVVFPVKAEAHELPFAPEFFDAIVAIDSYEYFGSDDRYIAYLSTFVKPGGQIGVVQPITFTELDGETPEHLRDVWNWEFHTWHTSAWWRRHWAKTGKVHVEKAAEIPDSARHWREWEDIVIAERGYDRGSAATISVDAGRSFGFGTIIARRI
jgi:SAM-dependent methyltransferase